MAITATAYASIFQANLDKIIVAEAKSTFMEANPQQIQYNGGKTIKIASLLLDGLANYSRSTGFTDGDITLEWKDYTLKQDRGRTFSIDSMDVDETKDMATAGNVLSEFTRQHVIPEIDTYRFNKIINVKKGGTMEGGTANASSNAPEPIAGQVVSQAKIDTGTQADIDAIAAGFFKDLAKIKESVGDLSGVAIVVSPTFLEVLNGSQRFQRAKNTTTISKGGVDYNVTAINEVPVIEVAQNRLTTDITLNNGASGSGAGFTVGTAVTTKTPYIIMKQTAATGIVKTDKVRIFAPDTNQSKDAWKIDLRIYHDLIITQYNVGSILVASRVA